MTLTELENELLDQLLEEASNHLANMGCNDYQVPNTPEGRELVAVVEADLGELEFGDGPTIYTTNFVLFDYLIEKLRSRPAS